MRRNLLLASLVVSTILSAAPTFAQPLTTAFTYQGELSSGTALANGTYDLRFLLFDAASGGTQIGLAQCVDNVNVANGRFTTQLDFGAQFSGQQRYLEIWVRADTGLTCANTTGFTVLNPRQNLTAAPNATFALNAAAATTAVSATSAATATTATNATQFNGQSPAFYQNAANLNTGTIPDARISGSYSGVLTMGNAANSFTGSFNGGGAGLTGLNASNLASGTLVDARLSTNVPRLNQSNAFTGATNTFVGPVGILRNVPAAGLDLNAAVNFIGLNANGLLYTNTNAGFVGVFESAPNDVTFGNMFGVKSPQTVSYGGMWVETAGVNGKPLYGYTNGASNAWTYLDGASLDWRLNNGGERMTVKRNGQVGIGTSAPTSMFEVQGNSGGFGTNLNNILWAKTSNNAVGIGTSTPTSVFEVQGSLGGLGTNLNNILYTNTFQTAVGIGTSSPVMPLNFASVQGNKISLWGTNTNAFYGFGIGSSLLMMHADTPTSDIAFGYGGTAFTENVRFKGNGRVGIGTATPDHSLTIKGDGFAYYNPANSTRIEMHDDIHGMASLIGYGPPGRVAFGLGGGIGGEAAIDVYDVNGPIGGGAGTIALDGGAGFESIYSHSGNVSVSQYFNSQGQGVIEANIKNFRVPNPRNDDEDIVYACPEGPEAAAYVRGTAHLVDGQAHIDLPAHFIDVTVSAGMTVQLTPNSPDSLGLAAMNKTNSGFDVVELMRGRGQYDFDWRVECVRKGHEDYKPIRPWDEVPQHRMTKEEAHAKRLRALETERQNSVDLKR